MNQYFFYNIYKYVHVVNIYIYIYSDGAVTRGLSNGRKWLQAAASHALKREIWSGNLRLYWKGYQQLQIITSAVRLGARSRRGYHCPLDGVATLPSAPGRPPVELFSIEPRSNGTQRCAGNLQAHSKIASQGVGHPLAASSKRCCPIYCKKIPCVLSVLIIEISCKNEPLLFFEF